MQGLGWGRGRLRLLDTSHGSHTWIFIGIVNNIFAHANSPAALWKNNNKKKTKIKAEDLRGQGCICPEKRGVGVGWLLCCGLGRAGRVPCCRISCRFAIKMLSMPKNYTMLRHPSGTAPPGVQFICGYNLIFNIHNSPAVATCHMPLVLPGSSLSTAKCF